MRMFLYYWFKFKPKPKMTSMLRLHVGGTVQDWVQSSKISSSIRILCDPRDCSLPGFSVHGISQARILEWVDISFSTFTHTHTHTHSSWFTARLPDDSLWCQKPSKVTRRKEWVCESGDIFWISICIPSICLLIYQEDQWWFRDDGQSSEEAVPGAWWAEMLNKMLAGGEINLPGRWVGREPREAETYHSHTHLSCYLFFWILE